MSNICKAFEMSDKDKQREHLRKLVLVENFGDECNQIEMEYKGKKIFL